VLGSGEKVNHIEDAQPDKLLSVMEVRAMGWVHECGVDPPNFREADVGQAVFDALSGPNAALDGPHRRLRFEHATKDAVWSGVIEFKVTDMDDQLAANLGLDAGREEFEQDQTSDASSETRAHGRTASSEAGGKLSVGGSVTAGSKEKTGAEGSVNVGYETSWNQTRGSSNDASHTRGSGSSSTGQMRKSRHYGWVTASVTMRVRWRHEPSKWKGMLEGGLKGAGVGLFVPGAGPLLGGLIGAARGARGEGEEQEQEMHFTVGGLGLAVIFVDESTTRPLGVP
jgi:hypothetical protein